MKNTKILINEIDNAVRYKNKESGCNIDKELLKELENSYIKHTKKK